MKKFFYILGAFLFSCCFLIACSYALSSQIKNAISEKSNFIYAGVSENFFVTLTCGEREDPYLHDGISMQKKSFSVICVTFYENKEETIFPFEITINQETHSGNIEKNMFGPNYMTDLEISINNDREIVIFLEDETIQLICKSNDFETSSEKAIDIAIENLNDELEEEFENAKFNAECYLKIINNPLQDKNIYFWFFTIKSAQKTVATIVIDTMSNSVLAKY